jgi:hypothetical protein
VYENFAVSWVIPAASGVALLMALLMALDLGRSLAYLVLRLDVFVVLCYHVLWRRNDLERLRLRVQQQHRGQTPTLDQSRPAERPPILPALVAAGAIILALWAVGEVF